MTDDPEDQRLEIRKYPNRRYYDTTRSRHLTLDEIRSLIRDGHDIRVIDSKSSVDITAQVLTQIILELETQKLDSFPVPLLVRLIRVNDQLVKDFIEKYFNQALHSFLEYQRQVEDRLRQVHGLPAVYPAVSAWTRAMLQPFTAAFSEEKPGAPTPSPAESEQLREMVRDLQQQIAELQDRSKRTNKKRPPQRAGAPGPKREPSHSKGA
jgi:polyhydroxyalkanoate synthesis repressor PhaR